MTALSHKEMAAHIRNRLKASKIKARVIMQTICGERRIRIDNVAYGARWSDDEAETIAICAKVNGLTHTQGAEINTSNSRVTGGLGQSFVYPRAS